MHPRGKAYRDALRAFDLDTLARDETGNGGEHGDAVIAACLNQTPALRAGGDPTHPEAIVTRFDVDSKWP